MPIRSSSSFPFPPPSFSLQLVGESSCCYLFACASLRLFCVHVRVSPLVCYHLQSCPLVSGPGQRPGVELRDQREGFCRQGGGLRETPRSLRVGRETVMNGDVSRGPA